MKENEIRFAGSEKEMVKAFAKFDAAIASKRAGDLKKARSLWNAGTRLFREANRILAHE
jgi:hypothetical protein